jgi:cell division protein FtsW
MNATAATLPRSRFRGPSPGVIIFGCALALTLLGLVVLSSAGQEASKESLTDPLFYFKRQVLWCGIAIVPLAVMSLIPLEWLRRFSWVIGILSVLVLLVVLSSHFGTVHKGARRWIEFHGLRLQPSDFGKLGLVICIASYLAANQRVITTFWRGFVLPMGIVAVFSALIIKEPDFGTAALCGIVGFTLLYLAGAKLLHILPTLGLACALFVVMVSRDPVRLARIESFLHTDDPKVKADGGYQLNQGILGFGSGGLTGVGLGQGRQQLAFLPEAHTDFVLAVVGEELGFFATAGVALIFLIIFIVSLRALRRAPNLYEFTLACGALLMLTGQALINMGVVTGLLPTKGMSLPFLSYGGTNLMLMFALVGLLMNCFRRWERPVLPRASEL